MIIAAMAWFHRRDYAAHRALDPTGLPPRFEQWQRRAKAEEKAIQAQGGTIRRVMLDPQKVQAWCEANNASVDSRARAQLAALVLAHMHDAKGQA